MINLLDTKIKALGAGLAIILMVTAGVPDSAMSQNNWMYFNDSEIEAEFNDRFKHNDVEFAMTTKAGTVDMGIEGNFMIIQFSDLFFENLKADIMDGEEEEYAFVESLKTAISSGVSDLLDRGLYIPVSEIAEADYENGRVILKDHDGEELFGELEVDDIYIVEDFRGRDARRFVNRMNRKIGG